MHAVAITMAPPGCQGLGGGAFIDERLPALLRDHVRIERSIPIVSARDSLTRDRLQLHVQANVPRLICITARMVATGEPYAASKFRHFAAWRRAVDIARHELDGQRVVTSGWISLLLAYDAGLDVEIHVAQNCEWIISQEFAPAPLRLLRDWERLRRLELAVLKRVSPTRIMALSRQDAQRLSEALGAEVTHLSPILGLPSRGIQEQGGERRKIGLLGSMHWPPNRQDVETLLGLMPQIWRTHPEAQLVVAGRGSNSYRDLDQRVKVMGHVATVDEFYDAVDIVAVPRFGQATGVSVKLVEALERGMDVIASDEASYALAEQPSWVHVADAERFVAAARLMLDAP